MDTHGGLVQRLECDETYASAYCHMMRPLTCHLMFHCEAENRLTFQNYGGGENYCSNNPERTPAFS